MSWNDLESYFGSRIFGRGESYFKGKRVTNLRTCSDGLLAEVQGSEKYVTLVTFPEKEDGNFTTACTCPYGSGCKHSVAVILTYVDHVKKKTIIPEAKPNDSALKLLKEGPRQDDLEDDFDDDTDYDDDNLFFEPEESVRGGKSYNTQSTKTDPNQDILEYLENYSKKALIELIVQISLDNSDLRQDLLDRSRLLSGKTKQLVSSIRKEISAIMSEPAWQNHWSDEGNLADFSRVEKNLKNLLSQGEYDAIVDIMKFMLKGTVSYVESCNDDGDSASQVGSCLEIGFKALKKCSWTTFDKLIFALEAVVTDDYDICHGASDFIDSEKDTSVWSKVADHFSKKLEGLPKQKDNDDFRRNYKRDRISNVLIQCLQKAGRQDEILGICESEARITCSWQRLVYKLIENKQFEKAKESAEEGIKSLGNKFPGITNSLRETIASLAAKKGDYSTILLLKQEDFLSRPSLSSFQNLLEASVKTKNKDEMRTWALYYLTTGKAPAKGALKDSYQYKERYYQKEFPDYKVLIDIAEKEKRIEDLWSLYKEAVKKKKYLQSHTQVASAIKELYPEESIKIWCSLAENQIAQTSPSDYVTAVSYLKEAKKLYQKTKREKEWSRYIADLSEDNKRKPRFIKELRILTGEKLL